MTVAIYLDHGATSPMSPEVVAAYIDALSAVGNPSSIHSHGQAAKAMLEQAREAVAQSVGADPVEVTFTSGGTEAINLALTGGLTATGLTPTKPPRILSTHAEHHATIDALESLEAGGARIGWIPVDSVARIDLGCLERELDDATLVSSLWANNEVGTIQPVAEIVALASAQSVPVHCDAVAAYGYVPIDFRASGLAAMSISAHKIGGPVGIGALVVARSHSVTPLVHGGGQQRFRSGTLDAAGAWAFGVAATRTVAALETRAAKLRGLRDRLVGGIRSTIPDAVYRGDPVDRLPANVHFTFPGCEGDSLLFLLDAAGFSVSTGSACQAGVPEASHVLLAMGLPEADARGALRFTLGEDTTEAELDALLATLMHAVPRAQSAGMVAREMWLKSAIVT